MRIHVYYVYILTNDHHTVVYIGVTNNLSRRVSEHKTKLNKSFTSRYNVGKLIYFETFNNINIAIAREKSLKGITRVKKEALINSFNPDWKELYNNGVIETP